MNLSQGYMSSFYQKPIYVIHQLTKREKSNNHPIKWKRHLIK